MNRVSPGGYFSGIWLKIPRLTNPLVERTLAFRDIIYGYCMTKVIDVAGAVFVNDGLVFAAKRGQGKNMAGKWEFPGGKVERGETPKEALARELYEELHIEATIGDRITTTEYNYDFGTVSLTTFYCVAAESTQPVLTEHEEVRWVPVSELDQLDWAPADIPAVELIMEKLR